MPKKGGDKNGDRKADRCGAGGLGTPPGHLARRLSAFDKLQAGGVRARGQAGGLSYTEGAFHKPGSNKK